MISDNRKETAKSIDRKIEIDKENHSSSASSIDKNYFHIAANKSLTRNPKCQLIHNEMQNFDAKLFPHKSDNRTSISNGSKVFLVRL